ncbi:hypothetical protein ACFVWZ_34435 [Streptomyces sp. NPDC058200]|uniref:hypothetical protein n=1 Tax=Streptomyces sp. NPDC058200 TaxID=3346378 RepID=UPI0036E1AAB4
MRQSRPSRQLSAPGRLAVWIVTSLAVAASAGCMSVSDEEEKPAPSRPANRHGAAAEPDGGTVAGAGAGAPGGPQDQGRTGRGGAEHAGQDDEAKGKDASPSPSSRVTPSPKPSKGTRPWPAKPTPPRDEPVPTKEPTRSVPPPSQPPAQSPDPGPEPEPEPTKPPGQPSAPPAAITRSGVISMDGMGMLTEPVASPQVGPV